MVKDDMRPNQDSMHSVMKPSMGMSMESRVSQHDNVDRHMDVSNQMSNMRNMYRDNQDMNSNMINGNMMGQEIRSKMRDMHRQNQAITTPSQYMVKDDFGNYAYSYNDQQSEKSEEGNSQSIKGQYAYIMANGVKRRVEYVADNNGFHVRDNADPARIKRSTEPDLLQTRMTSMMDSSSLKDHAQDTYRMSNVMGRDMPSNMDRNLMGMEQQRHSNMMGRDPFKRNMMGQDTIGHEIMGQDTMGRNMMGRNIYNIMTNRGMTSDVSNMMGRNMMGQDKNSQLTGRNMLGHQDMTPNTMYSNMMGQDRMSSNMINSRGISSNMMNTHSNNGLMGQPMMQKMEIEHVPETYTSSRLF